MKKRYVLLVLSLIVLLLGSCRSSDDVPTTNWQGGDATLGNNPTVHTQPTNPTDEPAAPTTEPTAPSSAPTQPPTQPSRPVIPDPVLSTEAEGQIKNFYILANAGKAGFEASSLKLEYYGDFDGVYVYFVDCNLWDYPNIEMEEIIGPWEFRYPSGQKLEVYKNGEVLKLKDAYEAGWLTDEAMAELLAYYQQVNPYLYE